MDINDELFFAILKNAKSINGDSKEELWAKAEKDGYFLSFGANKDEDYRLIVEDFCREEGGEVFQAKPTNIQLEAMEAFLCKVISDICDRERSEKERTKDDGVWDPSPGAIYGKYY